MGLFRCVTDHNCVYAQLSVRVRDRPIFVYIQIRYQICSTSTITISHLYTCTDFPEDTSKKNPKSNIKIAIGTSLGAAALIIILILGFCHIQRSRRNSDSGSAVENGDIELRPVATGNADAEEDELTEDNRHLPDVGSPADLGIIKETDQLPY